MSIVLLTKPSEPSWLELSDSVRLLVDLVSPVAEQAALTALVQGGGEDDAVTRLNETVAIAIRVIRQWDGVNYPDGQLAECTPENIENLMRYWPGAAIEFKAAWFRKREEWKQEGNG